jgi:hypothetical protein
MTRRGIEHRRAVAETCLMEHSPVSLAALGARLPRQSILDTAEELVMSVTCV